MLRGIRRREDSSWVIPGLKRGSHLAFLHGLWRLILERAGIKNLRIHDLRHSFASGGLLVGEGLPMIGKLLGHNKVQTTARYAHLANDPVKSAANRIASRIARWRVEAPGNQWSMRRLHERTANRIHTLMKLKLRRRTADTAPTPA